MENILLVEDDAALIRTLGSFLTGEGFQIVSAVGQRSAVQCMEAQNFDLALVDISLADGNGFSVCAEAKEHGIPVIFLTASGDEHSVVMGLDMGADDYIVKPFQPLELVARVKAQLRRVTKYNEGAKESKSDMIEISGLVLNKSTHQCLYNEKEVALTPIEFSILWLLSKNRGQVISSERLFEEVWKDKYFKNNNNTVMVHIRHLREKLFKIMGHRELIRTVWGVGYKIDD